MGRTNNTTSVRKCVHWKENEKKSEKKSERRSHEMNRRKKKNKNNEKRKEKKNHNIKTQSKLTLTYTKRCKQTQVL